MRDEDEMRKRERMRRETEMSVRKSRSVTVLLAHTGHDAEHHVPSWTAQTDNHCQTKHRH